MDESLNKAHKPAKFGVLKAIDSLDYGRLKGKITIGGYIPHNQILVIALGG
jgi:hypothetical protein